jgi:hypothetical protein
MGLFSFFKRNSKEAVEQTIQKELPEIKREDFVDDSDPNLNDGIIKIPYGTGKPIDIIYAFLEENYEEKGYDDALCNPDKSYKELRLGAIKNEFSVKLKRIITKYEDDLEQINFHITSRSQAGLVDLVKELESHKSVLLRHKDELLKMQKEISDESPESLKGIFASYNSGFLRGLAATTIEKIKS